MTPPHIRNNEEEGPPLIVTGDGYTRLLRSVQALWRADPQALKIPNFKLRQFVGGEILLLDGSRAPFRSNGKGQRCGVNVAAGGAGTFAAFSLFNVPPPGTGGLQVLSLMVIDAFEWQAAAVGTVGIKESDQTAIALQPTMPILLEDLGGSQGGNITTRPVDARATFRASAPGAPSVDAIISGLPNVGAAGLYAPEVNGDIVIFPGEAIVMFAGTANIAAFGAFHYRRIDFGGSSLVGGG